jgi:hypothetical protein
MKSIRFSRETNFLAPTATPLDVALAHHLVKRRVADAQRLRSVLEAGQERTGVRKMRRPNYGCLISLDDVNL